MYGESVSNKNNCTSFSIYNEGIIYYFNMHQDTKLFKMTNNNIIHNSWNLQDKLNTALLIQISEHVL